MEGRAFTKLLKNTSLLDRKLSSTDADLIFAKMMVKDAFATPQVWPAGRLSTPTWGEPPTHLLLCAQVKGKGAKKITFAQFEQALELVAEKKVRHAPRRLATMRSLPKALQLSTLSSSGI